MSDYASDKHPERGNAAGVDDSNSFLQVDDAAVRRLVRKTDLILMPVLSEFVQQSQQQRDFNSAV